MPKGVRNFPRPVTKKFSLTTLTKPTMDKIVKSNRCWFCTSNKSEDKNAFCCAKTNRNFTISRRTSNSATSWQSTMKAITTCAREATARLTADDKGKIWILTDDEPAFKMLNDHIISSSSVLECCNELNKIKQAKNIRIHLCKNLNQEEWFTLARTEASARKFHPTVEVTITNPALSKKFAVEQNILKIAKEKWEENTGTCKFSKENIIGFEKAISKKLLKLKKKECRVLTGLLTGHSCLNKSLKRWKISDTDECRWCHNGAESISHLLHQCTGTITEAKTLLGEEVNLKKSQLSDMLKFATDTELFNTFFKEPEPLMH